MSNFYKPGTDNQKPGQYITTGPRGGKVNDPKIINIDDGDRLPPTPKPGMTWSPKPGRPRNNKL